jgi:hypothetical protein
LSLARISSKAHILP